MSVEPLLIGRVAELEAVNAALGAAAGGSGPTTILVTGLGGSGTSALTRHAADVSSDRFADGQLTLNAAAPPAEVNGSMPSGRALLGWVLRELGLRGGDVPQSIDGRAAAYRALLAERQVLILVDNAVRVDMFVRLAPADSTSALLVAGRRRVARLPNATRLDISPLSAADGVALLAALAGAGRVAAEPASAAHLVALCSGLPLALHAAGKRLANCPQSPIRELVKVMSDPRRRLDLLDYDGLSVRASLARSAAGIADESSRVLIAMGTSPRSGLTARALATRMRSPVTQIWQALEELAEVRLATALRAGRYILANELVRLYARELDTD